MTAHNRKALREERDRRTRDRTRGSRGPRFPFSPVPQGQTEAVPVVRSSRERGDFGGFRTRAEYNGGEEN